MTYQSLSNQRQKRALNIVWAAAGQYGIWPDFLAFDQKGEPDIYLNSIVGLVYRHYDSEMLMRYIREQLNKSLFAELFTELFWLGLENAAYEKEISCRPALKDLRYRHAKRFLAEDASVDISLQQLMLRQELAHTLKCNRCREILGGPVAIINPWDKRLYQALAFTGNMNTAELIAAMENIIRSFFRFHWHNKPREVIHFTSHAFLLNLLKKIWPFHQGHREEQIQQLTFIASAADKGNSLKTIFNRQDKIPTDKELSACYGRSLFSQDRLAEITSRYCQGIHRQVCLWFSAEKGAVRKENTAYFHQHHARFTTELHALTNRLQNALLLGRQAVQLPARNGRLTADRVWRGLILHDGRVFSAIEPTKREDISVMLLLDGSASRQGRQSIIASQAYLLTEALRQVGIPLSVVSFFSQDGCTVLKRLKAFQEKSAQGIFAYKTQGWNRDGLALRALPELWRDMYGQKLLFILTDADPSDERSIPAQGIALEKFYGGEPACKDTKEAVKELRQQGIQIMALVNSVVATELVTKAAQHIYGEDYIILQSLSNMAQKVGDVLEQAIFYGHNQKM